MLLLLGRRVRRPGFVHYNRSSAEKDILDGFHAARSSGGRRASFLVGLRRHHPYPLRRMVGRLPQRLVLGRLGVNERYRRFFAN